MNAVHRARQPSEAVNGSERSYIGQRTRGGTSPASESGSATARRQAGRETGATCPAGGRAGTGPCARDQHERTGHRHHHQHISLS